MHLSAFTLPEANALLPLVKERMALLSALFAQSRKLADDGEQKKEAPGADGLVTADPEREAKQTFIDARIQEVMKELIWYGAHPRALFPAQADFPARRGAQTVALCWRPGEGSLRHWHAIGAPCSERRPIEDEDAFGEAIAQ
jgi:hypothetical protein